jgi:hypothetical protein
VSASVDPQPIERRKLTHAEVSSLGGLTTAKNLGPEGRKLRASKAGQATLEEYGRAHFRRAAFIRWGRLPGKKEANDAS